MRHDTSATSLAESAVNDFFRLGIEGQFHPSLRWRVVDQSTALTLSLTLPNW